MDLIGWIEERPEIIEQTEDWEEFFSEETSGTAESISFFSLRLSGHLACQPGQINDNRRLMLN